MKLIELLRLVFINLMSNKSKGMLTSLGIVVGSATIVLVIAIGQGGKLDVADQFKNLNAGAIEVTVGQSADTMMEEMMGGGGGMPGGGMPSGGEMPEMPSGGSSGGGMPSMGGGGSSGGGAGGNKSGPSMSGAGRTTLTTDDVDDIASLVPNVEAVSITVNSTAAVSGGELEDETEYTVAGVLADYQQISNLEIQYGNFFTEDDNEDHTKVAVLGYSIAQEIFGAAYLATGDIVTIEGKNYEVIGVLASMGTVSSGISPDDSIYIPYTTATKYVFGRDVSPQITAVASDVKEVDTVMENIEAVLSENYPNTTFTLTDAGSKMEAATSSANTLSMLLIAVATIVFIVGGIGIMNVLFVTVKERTQEIGILKALGCRKREILMEFLMEANLISMFGGIIGVAAGFALIPAVEMFNIRCEPMVLGGILALVFAVITGTVFGFYPAFKASKLTPIEALSQD
jgi:putative ABC transport system permease protein